ncbi:hypothetical protein GF354_00230 [Candidatus Peregrinibacteria bacterium]|nr:hypothetical protein [Candidatus Peregrinibacteria bacterium]
MAKIVKQFKLLRDQDIEQYREKGMTDSVLASIVYDKLLNPELENGKRLADLTDEQRALVVEKIIQYRNALRFRRSLGDDKKKHLEFINEYFDQDEGGVRLNDGFVVHEGLIMEASLIYELSADDYERIFPASAGVSVDTSNGRLMIFINNAETGLLGQKDIVEHEEDHAMNKFFEHREGTIKYSDEAKKDFKDQNYASSIRNEFLAQLSYAQDEATAYSVKSNLYDNVERIFDVLTKKYENGLSLRIMARINELVAEGKIEPDEQTQLYKLYLSEYFKYRETLAEGLEALGTMLRLSEQFPEILANAHEVLMITPIWLWPQVFLYSVVNNPQILSSQTGLAEVHQNIFQGIENNDFVGYEHEGDVLVADDNVELIPGIDVKYEKVQEGKSFRVYLGEETLSEVLNIDGQFILIDESSNQLVLEEGKEVVVGGSPKSDYPVSNKNVDSNELAIKIEHGNLLIRQLSNNKTLKVEVITSKAGKFGEQITGAVTTVFNINELHEGKLPENYLLKLGDQDYTVQFNRKTNLIEIFDKSRKKISEVSIEKLEFLKNSNTAKNEGVVIFNRGGGIIGMARGGGADYELSLNRMDNGGEWSERVVDKESSAVAPPNFSKKASRVKEGAGDLTVDDLNLREGNSDRDNQKLLDLLNEPKWKNSPIGLYVRDFAVKYMRPRKINDESLSRIQNAMEFAYNNLSKDFFDTVLDSQLAYQIGSISLLLKSDPEFFTVLKDFVGRDALEELLQNPSDVQFLQNLYYAQNNISTINKKDVNAFKFRENANIRSEESLKDTADDFENEADQTGLTSLIKKLCSGVGLKRASSSIAQYTRTHNSTLYTEIFIDEEAGSPKIIGMLLPELGYSFLRQLKNTEGASKQLYKYALLLQSEDVPKDNDYLKEIVTKQGQQSSLYFEESFIEDFRLYLLKPDSLSEEKLEVFDELFYTLLADIDVDNMRENLNKLITEKYKTTVDEALNVPTNTSRSGDALRLSGSRAEEVPEVLKNRKSPQASEPELHKEFLPEFFPGAQKMEAFEEEFKKRDPELFQKFREKFQTSTDFYVLYKALRERIKDEGGSNSEIFNLFSRIYNLDDARLHVAAQNSFRILNGNLEKFRAHLDSVDSLDDLAFDLFSNPTESVSFDSFIKYSDYLTENPAVRKRLANYVKRFSKSAPIIQYFNHVEPAIIEDFIDFYDAFSGVFNFYEASARYLLTRLGGKNMKALMDNKDNIYGLVKTEYRLLDIYVDALFSSELQLKCFNVLMEEFKKNAHLVLKYSSFIADETVLKYLASDPNRVSKYFEQLESLNSKFLESELISMPLDEQLEKEQPYFIEEDETGFFSYYLNSGGGKIGFLDSRSREEYTGWNETYYSIKFGDYREYIDVDNVYLIDLEGKKTLIPELAVAAVRQTSDNKLALIPLYTNEGFSISRGYEEDAHITEKPSENANKFFEKEWMIKKLGFYVPGVHVLANNDMAYINDLETYNRILSSEIDGVKFKVERVEPELKDDAKKEEKAFKIINPNTGEAIEVIVDANINDRLPVLPGHLNADLDQGREYQFDLKKNMLTLWVGKKGKLTPVTISETSLFGDDALELDMPIGMTLYKGEEIVFPTKKDLRSGTYSKIPGLSKHLFTVKYLGNGVVRIKKLKNNLKVTDIFSSEKEEGYSNSNSLMPQESMKFDLSGDPKDMYFRGKDVHDAKIGLNFMVEKDDRGELRLHIYSKDNKNSYYLYPNKSAIMGSDYEKSSFVFEYEGVGPEHLMITFTDNKELIITKLDKKYNGIVTDLNENEVKLKGELNKKLEPLRPTNFEFVDGRLSLNVDEKIYNLELDQYFYSGAAVAIHERDGHFQGHLKDELKLIAPVRLRLNKDNTIEVTVVDETKNVTVSKSNFNTRRKLGTSKIEAGQAYSEEISDESVLDMGNGKWVKFELIRDKNSLVKKFKIINGEGIVDPKAIDRLPNQAFKKGAVVFLDKNGEVLGPKSDEKDRAIKLESKGSFGQFVITNLSNKDVDLENISEFTGEKVEKFEGQKGVTAAELATQSAEASAEMENYGQKWVNEALDENELAERQSVYNYIMERLVYLSDIAKEVGEGRVNLKDLTGVRLDEASKLLDEFNENVFSAGKGFSEFLNGKKEAVLESLKLQAIGIIPDLDFGFDTSSLTDNQITLATSTVLLGIEFLESISLDKRAVKAVNNLYSYVTKQNLLNPDAKLSDLKSEDPQAFEALSYLITHHPEAFYQILGKPSHRDISGLNSDSYINEVKEARSNIFLLMLFNSKKSVEESDNAKELDLLNQLFADLPQKLSWSAELDFVLAEFSSINDRISSEDRAKALSTGWDLINKNAINEDENFNWKDFVELQLAYIAENNVEKKQELMKSLKKVMSNVEKTGKNISSIETEIQKISEKIYDLEEKVKKLNLEILENKNKKSSAWQRFKGAVPVLKDKVQKRDALEKVLSKGRRKLDQKIENYKLATKQEYYLLRLMNAANNLGIDEKLSSRVINSNVKYLTKVTKDEKLFIEDQIGMRGRELRDFSGWDFSGHDFENIEIGPCLFKGAKFKNNKFNNVDLAGAYFNKAEFFENEIIDSNFAHAHFDGANLENVDIDCSDFNHASFRNATIMASVNKKSSFGHSNFSHSKFNGATLSRVGVYASDFSDSKFNSSTIFDLYISGNFDNSDFSDSTIKDFHASKFSYRDRYSGWVKDEFSSFKKAKFVNGNIENFKVYYSDFDESDFTSATIDGYILDHADFLGKETRLVGTTFKNGNMTFVKFVDANMEGVSFLGSEEKDSYFEDMIFKDLNMNDAKFEHITFDRPSFLNSNFIGASFTGIAIYGGSLDSLDFTKAKITDTKIKGIPLAIESPNIQPIILNSIDFPGTVFRSVTIDNAYFHNVNTDDETEYIKTVFTNAEVDHSDLGDVRIEYKN